MGPVPVRTARGAGRVDFFVERPLAAGFLRDWLPDDRVEDPDPFEPALVGVDLEVPLFRDAGGEDVRVAMVVNVHSGHTSPTAHTPGRSRGSRLTRSRRRCCSERVTASVLVGRDDAIGEVLASLEGAAPLTMVVGDAGIGKSRLVTEAVGAAVGWSPLVGACLPLTDTLPLLAFVDALDSPSPDVRPLMTRALSQVPSSLRPMLAGLLPRTTGRTTDEAPAGDVRREQVFLACEALLDSLASLRPVVLVVEDVHWADPDTLDLITFLSRPRHVEGVHLLVTCRQDETGLAGQVAAWLERTRQDPRVVEVRLGPLSRPDVTALVDGLVGNGSSDALVDEVFTRGEGNPFFTEQLVASRNAERPALVPTRLADFLTGRVRTVSTDAQDVMRVLAVAGRPLPVTAVCDVTGHTEERCLEAVRELARASLVLTGPDGVRPRHALLREALVEELAGVPREFHRRLARALESLGDSSVDPEVAGHYRDAGDAAPELGASLRVARRAWDLGAYREAAQWWLRVIALQEELPSGAPDTGQLDPATAYLHAIRSLDLSGQRLAAHDLAQRAYARFDSWPDLPARRALLAEVAHQTIIEHRARGEARYEELLDLFEDHEASAEQARALVRYGALRVIFGEPQQGEQLLLRGRAVAEAAAADPELAEALRCLAELHRAEGDTKAAQMLLAEAAEVSSRTGDPLAILLVESSRIAQLVDHGSWTEAYDDAVAATDAARDAGLLNSFGAMLTTLSGVEAALAMGRTEQAAALLDGPAGGLRPDEWQLDGPRATIQVMRGDATQAVASLRSPGRRRPRSPEGVRTDAEHLVHALLWDGSPRDALEVAEAALDVLGDPTGRQERGRAGWLLVLAAWALADVEEGPSAARDRLVDRIAGEAPIGVRGRLARGSGDEAQWTAELARADGRSDGQLWRDAAAELGRLGLRHREAYCWWRVGQVETDRSAARDALVCGHRLASGHVPLRQAIARLAAELRVPLGVDLHMEPPAPTDLGVHLTAQEVNVLRLVAAGLSNQQIAETLVISPKTVSVHVSNLLRKLQVANRAQAAVWAERAGLTASSE